MAYVMKYEEINNLVGDLGREDDDDGIMEYFTSPCCRKDKGMVLWPCGVGA